MVAQEQNHDRMSQYVSNPASGTVLHYPLAGLSISSVGSISAAFASQRLHETHGDGGTAALPV